MNRADRLKEEIGWLKVTYAILAAIDISLIAWIVQNYMTTSDVLLTLCGLAVACVSASLVWVTRIAYRRLDELESV